VSVTFEEQGLVTALKNWQVGRIRGWRTLILRSYGGKFPPDILEEDMGLIFIVLVLFLLFGGGGYWGYRRWR